MAQVGMVEYINALPFHLPFQINARQTSHTFVYDYPSALNQKLRAGDLDMALTSTVEYLDGSYTLMPDFGIAANKAILSVNLYISGPLDQAIIGVTNESKTSIDLLKILCAFFWKVEPQFTPLNSNQEYDGMLLIGDEALKRREIPGYQTIDLAETWHEMTALPFVFALFAIREGIDPLQEDFEAALSWSENHREKLVEAAHQKCALPKSLINQYYDLCLYRLGEKEKEGLNLFQELRERVSKICA